MLVVVLLATIFLCNYFEFKVKFSWDCIVSEHNKQLDLDSLDSDY